MGTVRAPLVVVIFGPTASGKSALAVGLAERLGGEVINADSRQVYKRMQLLTAGPSADELARVRHHLFEFLEPTEVYSAGKWVEDVRQVMADVVARRKVPIVVGGTGFYLKALMDGLDGVPPVPAEVNAELSELTLAELQQAVADEDADLWRVIVSKNEQMNTQRLLRTLAVVRYTGVPLSAWQKRPGTVALEYDFVRIGLNPDVTALRARMERRRALLVEQGLLDEVVALADVPDEAPGLQSLTLNVWRAALAGEISVDEAVRAAARKDAQYAKRQRTWLRTQYKPDVVFEKGDVDAVMAWLKEKRDLPVKICR